MYIPNGLFGGDSINPFIKVRLGEHSFQTQVKYDCNNPEYNECIYIPSNYPSMISNIVFQLYTKNTMLGGGDVLLATENVEISQIEENNTWGQFNWLTFYTATDVNSSKAEEVRQGLVDGNRYGGQILVQIEREMTKNPRPIGSNKVLFNKSSSNENDLKSKLFADLAKELKAQNKDTTY